MKCRSICRADAASPSERTKFFSRGSVAAMIARGGKGDRADNEEARPPSGEVGDDAGDQAPAETAQARAQDIDPGDAGDLVGRPFVADIGDDHGEDRRQQQALDEAKDDDRVDIGRERDQRRRQRGGDNGRT